MATEEWAKELKKNTTIMKKTFEDNHLELLGFSFSSDNNSLHCYVEISARAENDTVEDCYIKLNLYDEDGDICRVEEEYISDFSGYDTIDIWCAWFDDCTDIIRKARLYVKKK